MSAWADFNLTMTEADDFRIRFTVKLSGVAQDISNWSKFWFTARLTPSSVNLFQLTSASATQIEVTTAASGLCTVFVAPAGTLSQLGTKRRVKLYCEIQGKDSTGKVYTLARGRLTVNSQITTATS